MAWLIQQGFRAGIEQVPPGLQANFFTLTFPASRAPDEDAAHKAFRSLIQRLRWRGLVEAYGWTLDRTKRGVLHHHGVMTMPFMTDALAEWRELIVASGFGVQNRLVRARPEHAGYCARYIATKVPDLAKRRRTHAFSRNFPEASYVQEQKRIREVGEPIGLEPECEWVPLMYLR